MGRGPNHPLSFCHSTTDPTKPGKLIRHKRTDVLITSADLFLLLYVDDGAVCFTSRQDMIRGITILEKKMVRLGLVMHAGREGNRSKTDFMFFPSPLSSKTMILNQEYLERRQPNRAIVPINYFSTISPTKKKRLLDSAYDNIIATQSFQTDSGGTITSTKTFKYLGSLFHYDLADRPDIEARISSAAKASGALKEVWECPYVDLRAKSHLYKAIFVNLQKSPTLSIIANWLFLVKSCENHQRNSPTKSSPHGYPSADLLAARDSHHDTHFSTLCTAHSSTLLSTPTATFENGHTGPRTPNYGRSSSPKYAPPLGNPVPTPHPHLHHRRDQKRHRRHLPHHELHHQIHHLHRK